MSESIDRDILKFISRLYKDLAKSDDVLRYSLGDDNDKYGNLNRYLSAVESMHKKVSLLGKYSIALKSLYHDKYVIKEEDIPDSVYELEEKRRKQRGITPPELSEEDKKEVRLRIIKDQKHSLDLWIDYFLSEKSNIYPFWLKYWAFQGMIRIGKFDKNTGNFSDRRKDTTLKFIDLNEEVLSQSMDLLLKSFNGESLDDARLDTLVKSGSFKKIYTYIISNLDSKKSERTSKIDGEWVVYKQGTDSTPLVESIAGHNTGWCLAGAETAREYLKKSDIHVYYSVDKENNNRIPRLAIETSDVYDTGNRIITQVRGIANNQNVEFELLDILEAKLKELEPNRRKYFEVLDDVKKLKVINSKRGQELTIDEINFLYEIGVNIKSFGMYFDAGTSGDPRIDDIRNARNAVSDLNKAFANIECLTSDLTFNNIVNANGLVFPKKVIGTIQMNMLLNATGITFPEELNGSLLFMLLEDANGLVLPRIVSGYVDLSYLKNLNGLVLPSNGSGTVIVSENASLDGVIFEDNTNYVISMGYTENSKIINSENIKEYKNAKNI